MRKKFLLLMLTPLLMADDCEGRKPASVGPTIVVEDTAHATKAEPCAPVDYHEGVLYFPCLERDFGLALSSFIGSHPDVEVVSMVGDGTNAAGVDRGYFVVVRPKK